ncbi:MAG TPA: winged helix-turn-helix domain-containing protein [Bryobacteraceae bacterium]|nr:winged helix-turn-helix domain-containing protein [Bryobacteraceae bacterium]
MSATEPSSTVRFGLFEADLAAGELRKRGRKIELQDQPFHVLALLLGRPQEVVTREELRQALWPADTFVEFDESLNKAVQKLRQALGDSADNPRFIETLPRKGYRFIAPVDAGAVQTVVPIRPHRLLLAGVASVLVLAGVVAVWLSQRSGKTAAEPPMPIPLTTDPGDEWNPSFSPDGNQVAFARYGDIHHGDIFLGQGDIYIKLIGASEPLRLTTDPANDYGPAWSPDGRSIAFLRDLTAERSGVFLMPAIGGGERKVAEVHRLDVWGPHLSWHPGGRWVVVSDKNSAGDPQALFLLSVETGEKRRLTLPPRDGTEDYNPAVSPDGRRVMFARCKAGLGDLYALELSDDLSPRGEPKRLTFENRYTAGPAWWPDGRSVVFISSASVHITSLWRMALRGFGGRPDKPERLAFAGEGAREAAVSRQGRLVYANLVIDADIWRMELKHGPSRTPTAGSNVKLISSTRLDHTPAYSQDGRRIAFASNRSGSHEIWVCSSDGSHAVQVSSFGGPYIADPRWSPDGEWIIFGGSHLIRSDGGPTERLTGDVQGWSRDGRWLYIISNRSGEPQIWKTPWPLTGNNRQPRQITKKGGGYFVRESLDGRFVYYLKGDLPSFALSSLWKVPVDGGEESRVIGAVYADNYAVADHGIYFIPNPQNAALHFLDLASGKVAKVASLDTYPAYGFSVSPDGRWLLYTQYAGQGSDLMLVENFR